MTVARIASRAVFAFSSALLVIALCDLWQWFWHAHIRTWHLSLQGLVLLTLMVSLGVVTWKAMRAAREFAETNGQNGLVVYSGYGHLAAACVPTAMVLFISDEGWLLGYNAVLAMALIVCGWQAARYNRGLQVVRSLLVQIVFPFLFVFLGMFAAVHASSEENRQEEEVQGFKDRGDMAGLRAFLTQKEEVARKAARYCDEQISKAILGQTLTSDSGGGSYAQSKTHNDVRHDLTVADCKALASTLRRDLIRPLCIFNFGEDKRIPYIRFDCEESEDLTQTATILGTLIEKVGLRIPTSFVYKKFSIPEPEEGDEIAKPTYGGGMGGVLPFKSDALLSLKAGADAPIGTQQHIDRLAAAALHKGVGSFKRAFEPVLKMIENADSLEQLRELMEDDTAVAELYAAMDVSEVEELLQKVMLYADLEGRVVEDG